MKNNELMNKLTRMASRTGLKLKKHSPEILLFTGIATGIAAGVTACRATLKVNEVLEEHNRNIAMIHDCMGDQGLQESGKYTEEDGKKDLTIQYAHTGVELVKLYGPSIALGVFSIGCILSSNNILKKRYISMASAYMAVDEAFKNYRGGVIERFGEQVDKELRYNIKAEQIEETVKDDLGNEQKVKKTERVAHINGMSEYARIFDETNSTDWTKDPDYNLMFIRAQQQYANDLLRARGHLFLNEVFDMLGMDRTSAGQIVGWIYNPDNQIGDDYVDFGLYETHIVNGKKIDNDAFLKGFERSVILDFNVAGPVYQLI